MKKLFVLGTLLTIFLLLSGCQSESPVAPVQTNDGITLNKPGPIPITIVVEAGKVNVSWERVGGAKSYQVEYFWTLISSPSTITIATTTTSETYCSFTYAPQVPGYYEEVLVTAYRKNGAIIKGTGVFVSSP